MDDPASARARSVFTCSSSSMFSTAAPAATILHALLWSFQPFFWHWLSQKCDMTHPRQVLFLRLTFPQLAHRVFTPGFGTGVPVLPVFEAFVAVSVPVLPVLEAPVPAAAVAIFSTSQSSQKFPGARSLRTDLRGEAGLAAARIPSV